MVDLIEGGTNVGGTYVGGTYVGGTYVGGRKVAASLISVSWPLSTKFEIANKSLTFWSQIIKEIKISKMGPLSIHAIFQNF